ncbi:SDR family NAD(P)-dependent oxidoreductase [Antrihabitans sp. YC2-6]|uniref:SDR family NAD(P)-dependent oxidoreductase n=1 Tax=Antrihabitans sp. YC2-6 TaxID=2799498 RepID=UPI0018F66DB7|nr:SDR family NAD(P)-dependent oxidoreductase [Antrihabitans sp. YC2-6]MBJ8344128.1 SDR family NAD(P)-dependent oxidoreductase [Antrihabitans sp. YC2-6]
MAHSSLNGLSVAITGGGRGIGREIAAAFLGAGARVAIGDIDVDAALATAAELGNGATGFPLDVTDPTGFAAFLDGAEAALGPLDVLVNNAGIMPIGPFLAESDAVTDRVVDIDVRGVLTGTKLAGQRFHARGSGHVVNIASIMGTLASPNAASYCAAKYAVVGFGQALRQEWRGSGVHITTICPGFVRTELIAGMKANKAMEKLAMVDPDAVAAAVLTAVGSGRSGQVFVPKTAAAFAAASSTLPGDIRDTLFRLAGGASVTETMDLEARAAYQKRVEGK